MVICDDDSGCMFIFPDRGTPEYDEAIAVIKIWVEARKARARGEKYEFPEGFGARQEALRTWTGEQARKTVAARAATLPTKKS